MRLWFIFSLLLVANSASALQVSPESENADLIEAVVQVTQRRHLVRVDLNDRTSAEIFESFLESLDPAKLNFTQGDVAVLARWRTLLDDQLRDGRQAASTAIYNRFLERSEERLDTMIGLLDEAVTWDYEDALTLQLDAEKRDYAADEEALRALWRLQVRNQMVNLLLTDMPLQEAIDKLERRFLGQKTRLSQTRPIDVVSAFLNAYTRVYDPHTSYLSPRNTENFDMSMSLQLQGIGAVLRSDDELTQVVNLIAGGPAERAGELQASDRILGVGQEVGEMVDVVGWRIDEVVQLIRGPKGSKVRLEVLPAGAAYGSATKTISIVRDVVQLEDQSAKAEVIELERDGQPRKVGVINVPTFYTDFQARQAGDPDYRSTTRDVARLIEELKVAGIEGLVIDLRGNGGGALQEANSLTGLFIRSGPVVQVKGTGRRQSVLVDQDPRVAWGGPLLVLVDRTSASASEIFAGAIQDYGRGIVMGNATFGKGTVQALIPVGKGQIKLTQAKFYRISGESTQHRGVMPDLALPFVVDPEVVGESSLDRALPYDEIDPSVYRRVDDLSPFIPELRAAHDVRTQNDPNFVWWEAHIAELERQRNETQVPLSLTARRAFNEIQSKRLLDIENQRREALGLEAAESFADVDTADIFNEAGLNESAEVLLDMIDGQAQGRIAGTL